MVSEQKKSSTGWKKQTPVKPEGGGCPKEVKDYMSPPPYDSSRGQTKLKKMGDQPSQKGQTKGLLSSTRKGESPVTPVVYEREKKT